MEPQKDKLLFYQICGGNLAREGQAEFEKMQVNVERLKTKMTMTIKLTVFPSEIIEGSGIRVGEASYEVIPQKITRKSGRYAVEVNREGMIIGDGKTVSDVLQHELVFEDGKNGNQVQFKQNG